MDKIITFVRTFAKIPRAKKCETMFMIVTQHRGFCDTEMLNQVVNVRVPKRLKEKMDQAVERGLYTNRSDFVRNAIREKLKEEGEVT